MVLGMATAGKPSRLRRSANDRVSSPPIGISASRPRWLSTRMAWPVQSTLPSSRATRSAARTKAGTSSGLTATGLVRELCSIVPPVRSILRTASWSSFTVKAADVAGSSGSMPMTLAQPRRRPTTSMPWSAARLTTALIATFRPGTSPPPVRMPMRATCAMCPPGRRRFSRAARLLMCAARANLSRCATPRGGYRSLRHGDAIAHDPAPPAGPVAAGRRPAADGGLPPGSTTP